LLSGSRAKDTTTANSVNEPNMKYGPDSDLDKKRGVENATAQFIIQFVNWPRLEAAALVWIGCISEETILIATAQDIPNAITNR